MNRISPYIIEPTYIPEEPVAKFNENRAYVDSGISQAVFHSRWNFGINLAINQTVALELAKLQREDALRHGTCRYRVARLHMMAHSTEVVFDSEGQSAISAEDYADALVDELETPAHSRAQFTIAY